MNKDENIGDLRLSDIISHIKPFFRYLATKYVSLLVAIILGACIGIGYFKTQKPNYKGISTFVLEEKQAGLGSLGGLASQFGFDIGGLSSGGGIFSDENIFEILKSKKILQKVLLSKVDSLGASEQTLADLYLNFSRLKNRWKGNSSLLKVSFENLKLPLTNAQDSVLTIIYDKILDKSLIVDKAGKKGNLIKVQVEAENRQFANLMSKRIVDEAKDLYINIKVGNLQTNINAMQRKADSLLRFLNGKTYVAAQKQMIDANPGLTSLRVPAEIAGRDKTVAATLYGEVVKNLEASKMILAQQTPIIQIIDTPQMSAKDNLLSLKLLIVIGIVSMFSLVIIASLVQYITYAQKNATK